MTNMKTTKRALVSSALALFLCFAMLLGTTYAWFTDEVSSEGNIIQTGTLDVIMEYADGTVAPDAATWNDAAKGKIFNYDNWEPGYVDAKHIKITNVGSLALNYYLRVTADSEVSKLADVIDVYYFANATALERANVEDGVLLGTLADIMGTAKNISNKVKGTLVPAGKETTDLNSSVTLTLALKMQEDAGNEYQNLSIGVDGFAVELIATQATFEEDAFDDQYDAVVPDPAVPAALVRPIGKDKVLYSVNNSAVKVLDKDLLISKTKDFAGMPVLENINLDAAYMFQPTGEADISEYKFWHADYVVKADKDVNLATMALAGYYEMFGGWVAITEYPDATVENGTVVPANEEIRLLEAALGASVNYNEICEFGNDGMGFLCGLVDLTGANAGTTITVELRIYETTKAWDATSGTANEETGNYITVGEFEHTFGGNYVTLEDNTVLFYADDGEVVLYDTQNVTATTYTVPADVTVLGNYSFSYNTTIEEVTLSESVTSLGRAFDSNTSIKKVTLNEGLKQIDSRAFRATAALEEVEFSSTVKTIADNAFQKSAIKSIVIPATVETVGEAAFGASKIETVTFEGNTSIQGYAFRGCPDLGTVYLNGDDTTFVKSTLNGRDSTWFCNSESNNPNTSNITFYVQNSTVASRVKTAMGAEANNTPIYINGKKVDVENVNDATKLQDALANAGAGDIICLTNDVTVSGALSNSYGSTALNMFGGVFDGNGHTIDATNCGGTWDSAINITGGTIKNVVVNSGFRGIFVNHNNDTAGKVYLENVVIDGPTYTISCDQGTNNGLEAVNSTFNGWTSYAATIGDVKFTDCYFGEGAGYAFCRPYAPTVFVNCEFEAGYQIDPRAAVIFENCTLNGVLITAENVGELVTSNVNNATVK